MINTHQPLTEDVMAAVMTDIMEGRMGDSDLAALLTQMTERGPTADEIVGAARVLRQKAVTLKAPPDAVDCCGTGGDGLHTYNVSTAVALVAAACGVPVAKHGNRASSSKSGAADVLEALGINLDISSAQAGEALEKFNFSFLMAPRHHAALKHAAAARKKLGFRTIFNLLGPLANPAGTKRQLIGVYDERFLLPMAEALKRLGAERAWVVHGADGLDEISVSGPTRVAVLDDGAITERTLTPSDFDIHPVRIEKLKGGDAEYNARALTRLLHGTPSAYRDIVLANAAAVLAVHGNATDLKKNVFTAAEAIDSGAAQAVLDKYREFSQSCAG